MAPRKRNTFKLEPVGVTDDRPHPDSQFEINDDERRLVRVGLGVQKALQGPLSVRAVRGCTFGLALMALEMAVDAATVAEAFNDEYARVKEQWKP